MLSRRSSQRTYRTYRTNRTYRSPSACPQKPHTARKSRAGRANRNAAHSSSTSAHADVGRAGGRRTEFTDNGRLCYTASGFAGVNRKRQMSRNRMLCLKRQAGEIIPGADGRPSCGPSGEPPRDIRRFGLPAASGEEPARKRPPPPAGLPPFSLWNPAGSLAPHPCGWLAFQLTGNVKFAKILRRFQVGVKRKMECRFGIFQPQ